MHTLRPLQPKIVHPPSAQIRVHPGSNHSQSLIASNLKVLWPTDMKYSALKDLNLFQTVSKVQEASRILKMVFALSKWSHLLHKMGFVHSQMVTTVHIHIRKWVNSMTKIPFALIQQTTWKCHQDFWVDFQEIHFQLFHLSSWQWFYHNLWQCEFDEQ